MRLSTEIAAVLLGLLAVPRALASPGTEGAAFLDVPVGGRPAALGGAYSALASDAYAPVWNPAGLGLLQSTELAGMHLSYLESMSYEFAGLAQPLPGRQAIGLAAQYFRPGTTAGSDANGNPTGDFTGYYAAYSAAYGRALTPSLSLGVAGKAVDARIADAGARAYALDLGAMVRVNERIILAVVAANLGTGLRFIGQEDPLPLAYRLGLSYRPLDWLGFVLEGAYNRDRLPAARTGIELGFYRALSLRAGWRSDTAWRSGPAAGAAIGLGLTIAGQRFDYAFLPMGDLGAVQYFSVVLKWGSP